jgi:hypothetical protein
VVRWVEGGSQPEDDYTILYGNGRAKLHLGTGYFLHKGIISPVKRMEFISDRTLYITLRGPWCDIIVLNVHAPTEDKIDDMKDSFNEELECVPYEN